MKIDKIVKSLTKMVSSLEKVQKEEENKINDLNVQIQTLKDNIFISETEVERAKKIKENLSKIVGV